MSVYYNAGCYDTLTGIRIWEMDTDQGRFLSENGKMISLDSDEVDENYMSYAHVRYKLSTSDAAAYKFIYESL